MDAGDIQHLKRYRGHAKENGYMDMSKWKACQVDELPIDTRGMSVYVGFDMYAKLDLFLMLNRITEEEYVELTGLLVGTETSKGSIVNDVWGDSKIYGHKRH